MKPFQFKHFTIQQSHAALKVGTDAFLLGSFCDWQSPQHLLDIGTGTGVLSIMAAQRFPLQTITAIDISEQALIDARTNFQNAPFDVEFAAIQSSLQDFTCIKQFDAIICNPPYFENSSKNEQKELTIARHADALPFRELIQKINALLSNEGKAWLIFPADYLKAFEEKLKTSQMYITHEIKIMGKPMKLKRSIVCLEKNNNDRSISYFTIRNEDGSYSEAYKALTIDFHDRIL